MRLFWALIGALGLSSVGIGQTHVSNTVVVYDSKASKAEVFAASEMAAYLSKITGQHVKLSTSGKQVNADEIVVGQGELARKLCRDIRWNRLGPEEVVIRSTPHGLVVAGGNPRGTVYAVYRLLGRLGVRWWTPWATDVPKDPNLVIPKLNVREVPGMEFRSPYGYSNLDNAWTSENCSNFGANIPDEEHGGQVDYAGFVHTYYALVPPDPYFKQHPEWFSMIDGKRTTDNAQLCTTDPKLRAFVLEQVKKELRKQPTATIVSVSQNDCFNPCQCDRCRALVKEQGSESALVLDLANYVADGIKDEFPNVAVDTLAYQWSRHAPKSMKPRPNVIVRLCSIECDFGQPLDAPKNAAFAKDIIDWSRLTHRLYVWDYITNFAHYIQPLPNEAVLGPNIRFFANNGVKGIFEEGDYTSNGGAMMELKCWLLAQLLWDPKADDGALTKEFLTGYYGTAGDAIGRYLQLIDDAGAKTACTIYQGPDAPYFSYSVLRDSEKLWQEAEAAVANDTDKLWRVRQSHLSIQYVFLNRWDELKKAAAAAGDPWLLPPTRDELVKQWLTVATGPGPKGWSPVTAVNEGSLKPEDFVKGFH
ncbi:MAG TPA: DUF4838 domain-containing protein [Fimbriimonas sp.]|nr:DUF4838 domain-containing protein [Fimbriimonas sp.]